MCNNATKIITKEERSSAKQFSWGVLPEMFLFFSFFLYVFIVIFYSYKSFRCLKSFKSHRFWQSKVKCASGASSLYVGMCESCRSCKFIFILWVPNIWETWFVIWNSVVEIPLRGEQIKSCFSFFLLFI